MDTQAKLQGIGNLGAQEHWLIDLDELWSTKMPKILGVGGFGFVMPAYFHGAAVVVKTHRATGHGVVDNFVQELRLLRRIRHPNLVTFYGACVEPGAGELILVLEHIHGCELPSLAARSREEVGLSDRAALAHDVACAVEYLHTQTPSLVHGDIKAGRARRVPGLRPPRLRQVGGSFGQGWVRGGPPSSCVLQQRVPCPV